MISARATLAVATRGGAEVLGRSDIGTLEAGKAADVACYRVDDVTMAGAADLVAALVLTGPHRVDRLVVHGRSVVVDGRLVGLDLPAHLERHRRLARSLLG
jgi:cytosine/adenosine deaminase-related metal-dependent hydrolase